MMRFTPIASSSKGNAYLVEADGLAPLLLEAGLPIRALREKLNFGLSGLAGCLVSHDHGDHSKAVKDLLKAGVDCYMSRGTALALGVHDHHRLFVLEAGRQNVLLDSKLQKWVVLPFHLEHDAADPLGFFISHNDDRLLFIPDTAYVENRFDGVTILAIECNNIESILSENIINGHIPAVVGRRVRRNHLSLENVIEMLKSNDLSKCRRIYLLHLSDGNSDEQRMKLEVQQATGIATEICA
jgi:phosphoribosyl 1,2-cyclic phosphodiesterase